ncbi:hypothetical protein HDU90_002254 [Geranomyces variabilis]|nr:hypothetical protein HDU90_002254 [Geranomyces variabilis]
MAVAYFHEPGTLKYAAWGTFCGTAAAARASLPLLYHPALLVKASLYRIGFVGGTMVTGAQAAYENPMWVVTKVFYILTRAHVMPPDCVSYIYRTREEAREAVRRIA